jgi:hypothetical protein
MRFQPGQSGNPAGRPAGSQNKETLAAQAVLEERAEEMVTNIMDRAKNGDPTAMRLCMERLVPTGRNRPVAIDLPVVKTPDDAQAALAVVTAELAAGTLTISDASALITLIDRMLRLAERMWNFERARRYGARRDAILLDDEQAPEATAQTPQTAEKPDAPLYSPVNSGAPTGADARPVSSRREAGTAQPGAPSQETPLPRAA